jgi:hypothetical protein
MESRQFLGLGGGQLDHGDWDGLVEAEPQRAPRVLQQHRARPRHSAHVSDRIQSASVGRECETNKGTDIAWQLCFLGLD